MTLIGNAFDKETVEKIKQSEIPVVILGAGIVGEVLFHACRKAGIDVECFCDNNINKTSTFMCRVEVIHTPDLKHRYKDANIFISTADIKDAVDQLHELGYFQWYAAGLLLRDFDVHAYGFSAPADFVEYAVDTCLFCQDNYLSPDKLFMRSVDIIITERCSLKCRDCANLMQYYKKPVDCNLKALLASIDAFCYIVDAVNEFRVLGGEPLMNKELHLITKRLIDEPKVKKVVIYTNGTMVPRTGQIEYLKDKKVLFIITDYGVHSRKRDELITVLERHNISYYAQKARGWTDCAKIRKHDRTMEQQKEVYKSCCAKNTITLSNGRLYRCPFSANADRLQAVPDDENDYVDIFQRPRGTAAIQDLKEKIRTFLFGKDCLHVCDYCNGRPFGAPEITPANQTATALEYKRYDTQ